MKESLSVRFLYNTLIGRILLKLLTQPFVSKICGALMNSHFSALFIPAFIKKNNINMDEFENVKYNSFNDFFTRKIKPDKRPYDYTKNHLISPCDAFLSVYSINSNTTLPIKKSKYTISELIKNEDVAKEFEGGLCLVFRLCPNHYHRYIYIDNGLVNCTRHIEGVLHTVRPIAFKKYNVYSENTREYTIINSENLGTIIQMEIGALMVGKIDNYQTDKKVTRGQEKGRFLFGGSTIILLVKSGVLNMEENTSEKGVKIGEFITESIINN